MDFLKDVSIKHKLTMIAVLPSTFILLTAILIFFIYDKVEQKQALVQETTMLTQVIGANNRAALLFNDANSANENLAVLSTHSHIVSGGIFYDNGNLFAGYFRNNVDPSLKHPAPQKDGYFFDDNNLTIFNAITSDNANIGTVYIRHDLTELNSRRNGYIAIAATILALVSALVIFLSAWLNKAVSEPVTSLAETAKKITLDKDYTTRASGYEHGEFGLLINGFNEMLDQIQERDARLEKHSEELEQQVSIRTAELKTSNANLRAQIEENVRIEEELFRRRQLESLGILAGGIAHDFNNLLAAILMNTSLAKRNTPVESKAFVRLEGVEKACIRAKDLTGQLLTFSKGGAPIMKVTSIADIICDSARFVFRGSKTLCSFDICENIWPVEVDEGQISQVIHNLAINADQAMPDGGTVQISLENLEVTADSRLNLKPGRYVRISVADSGSGIPKETLSRIFTPYFTTKETGSGLGLATSYSIISRHKGLITVDSELGVGTTFRIYLPASDSEPQNTDIKVKTDIVGSGRVLIMDDDEHVQQVTGEALTHAGFKVGYANCGAEAIESYLAARDTGEPYDLVIMDLTIPGRMGGEETIKKLLELAPDAKAIAASGYAHGSIMSDYKSYGFKGVLAKPFSLNDLSQLVDQVIRDV